VLVQLLIENCFVLVGLPSRLLDLCLPALLKLVEVLDNHVALVVGPLQLVSGWLMVCLPQSSEQTYLKEFFVEKVGLALECLQLIKL